MGRNGVGVQRNERVLHSFRKGGRSNPDAVSAERRQGLWSEVASNSTSSFTIPRNNEQSNRKTEKAKHSGILISLPTSPHISAATAKFQDEGIKL
jgi:hypothetical protein